MSTLAPVAALRTIAGKVINQLRPTPPAHHRHGAGPASVGPPHPVTAPSRTHYPPPRASTQDIHPGSGVAGLPHAHTRIAVPLRDGDTLPLWIGSVQKQLAGRPTRMLAYNGSIPGPLLRVAQGSDISVEVTINAGRQQSVHWHGLRPDNRTGGGPDQTEQPIPVLRAVSYRLRFPDPGLYWYHSRGGEDDGQEFGLHGQVIVDPARPHDPPPVDREIPLTFTEILIAEDQLPAVPSSWPAHTVLGLDGTVVLVNGEIQPSFAVARGEVVRLYLTNTATTGIVNLAITGAALKVVGGDSGRYGRAEFVDGSRSRRPKVPSSRSCSTRPATSSWSIARPTRPGRSPPSPWERIRCTGRTAV